MPIIGDRLRFQHGTHSDPTAYEVMSRTSHQDRNQGRQSSPTKIFVDVVPAEPVPGNIGTLRNNLAPSAALVIIVMADASPATEPREATPECA